MKIQTITPKKAVNKAYLKERINKTDIEQFKQNFVLLFDRIQATDKESEENRKYIVSDFLKSFYTPQYEINTKGRKDLVIHTGKTAKEPVAVIFETKKPDSSEMMNDAKPNSKAMQQLVLYYLDERIEHKNTAVKHLIATDIFNWYIFDENLFDKHIYRNPKFIKGYETYKQGGKDTEFFYKSIAKPLLDDLDVTFECTHFNLKDYEKTVRNTADTEGDKTLIALYKIFSPVHLLKLPFANDSNQLDKSFYTELLHIIGLEEIKDGSKKLIKPKAKPDEFSLLENTLTKIENKGFSNITDLQKFGSTKAEQAENIALELCITWVNRILFLKLLEAQLITYHKGNTAFRFLNSAMIYDYDRLNKLFFEVLAEKTDNRKGKVKTEFAKIPYLNSSLFERTDLERKTIEINYLDDREEIPILSNTVLKDAKGKKETGNLPTLEYLFAFLDSYDFASEGTEGIQDDKRTLINASVLGLIFEKINGYKDGSFFTPSFITMYMCRETIRRAVVQKFKENGYKSETFDALKDEIRDSKEANNIVNSLKICDPAVGSGHFLVSALNEIIAIKSDLDILSYRDGKRVKFYKIEIQNDELIVADETEGDIFQYFVNEKGIPPKELQKLQETLFHEKQTIIENCLFGVDINPNSVKICRLRLWIELLKNAYYTEGSHFSELETLPNIDINIKQGNSLISRFKLDDDLSDVFKKQGFSYKNYRKAVEDYKNTNSKDAKADLVVFIENIKEQFKTAFHTNMKEYKDLSKFKGQLLVLRTQGDLFGGGIDTIEEDRLKKLVAQFEQKVSDIKDNAIFSDAFEWRFEFPEVLNTEGGYVGFDVVIGNPPYIPLENFAEIEKNEFKRKYTSLERKYESSVMFIIEGLDLLHKDGYLSFIAPLTWQTGENYSKFRELIYKKYGMELIVNLPFNIFEDAYVDTAIYILSVKSKSDFKFFAFDKKQKEIEFKGVEFRNINVIELKNNDYKIVLDSFTDTLLSKFSAPNFVLLGEITKSTQGLSSSNFEKTAKTANSYPFLEKGNVYNYHLITENIYETSLNDKPSLRQFYEAEPKILIRRIINRQDRLSVGFTDQRLIFKKDINPFIPTNAKFSAKFLLGIVASKLISFIYLKISVIATKNDFRQTTLSELRRVPIPNISAIEQAPIIKLVEQILSSKQRDPSVSTAEMEKEIDNLVYGLYDLTAAEIGIIEQGIK